MSDDSTQLSVAELLARNGQGVPSSGGGRRRRSGRGISVTELTGDQPVVREGSSAHAAPDPEADDASGAIDYGYGSSDYSAPSDYSASSNYSASSDYSSSLPDFDAGPAYSPLSGPISLYDPLGNNGAHTNGSGTNGSAVPESPAFDPSGYAPPAYEPPAYEQRSYQSPAMSDAALRDPAGYGWPDAPAEQTADADPDPFGGTGAPPPTSRRARRERMEAMEAMAEPPPPIPETPEQAPPGVDGWRRRGPDEQATEIRPLRGPFPQRNGAGPGPAGWAPARPPEGEPPFRGDQQDRMEPPPRNGAGGPPPPGLPAWSARRRHPAEPPAPPGGHPMHNGVPAPVEPNGAPAWALADQQLVSGPTVAGDLLRDKGNRRGFAPADIPATANDRTDVYAPVRPGDLDSDDSDEFDDDLNEFDDFDEFDDDEDDESGESWAVRAKRAVARRAQTSKQAVAERARTPRSEEDANRRQWLVLAGQVAGAAVAGMLLFKGFEKMWDVLPFVALMLAMVVILGLVALVRVLRRTDDIMSTVIAVIVGIFVTLGPLAFLLSTN
ncbi:hypothetical protein [Nocardia sp. BMG51109]|uniref:hypothetical protein n=1 Tax=Nocardia sp. BMG51109 TaxID=1056816 RepID=UPI00046778C2|nr:hypothetical protein [Nocardia sp. BMG51109]